MNQKKLSVLQQEYRQFFIGKMNAYGISSPAQLSKENKSKFFSGIKNDWACYKLEKLNKIQQAETLQDSEQEYENVGTKAPGIQNKEKELENIKTSTAKISQSNDKSAKTSEKTDYDILAEQGYNVLRIVSLPNPDQKPDLQILYSPNNFFNQDKNYNYPVVKMPQKGCLLKLPREGRSNQKGYKEKEFYDLIKTMMPEIGLTDSVHMLIPNYNKPYEPDIVLYDKSINLYIDIEIDEPYDGYYRYPTHAINPEQELKQDDIRDLFFTESGWIVIRFTEKQVHCEAQGCIEHIKQVIESIYKNKKTDVVICNKEEQWDYNQSIQWQKINYREKYLGIESFRKRYTYREIEINLDENDEIENNILRTKKVHYDTWNNNIAFDEINHKYVHPKDQTGNAEYISVTTLIERFFPFDLKRFVEKKALDEKRTEEDILDEYLTNRDEAAEKGTFLHEQIEGFLKNKGYDDTSDEFLKFLDFYEKEINSRNLLFFDAEYMIVSHKFNVAGTIDCLFKKQENQDLIMIDWKRSKKLIIDGHPRKYGFGFALSELRNIDNSSYYRYCLQQNIYKHIIETEYNLKISSMKLVVLHNDYDKYYVIPVPPMPNETKIILNSIKHKI